MDFSNDVSINHHPEHNHSNHLATVVYKECLKNHMASLGDRMLDGCSEFVPSSTIIPDDPRSIKCAVCGCHQNFHRCERKEPIISQVAHHVPEYQSHYHNHPPSPPPYHTTNFVSPQPISAYPPIPHMVNTNDALENMITPPPTYRTSRRFRTKFTQLQKEKMYEFSKKVGWKTQKINKGVVMDFCNEISVSKRTLQIWMNNNKNTFGKRYDVNVNNGSINVNDNDNDNGSI